MSLDTEAVGRFYLPFDGGRPVLVCGHPRSGKTSFVRHVIAGLTNRTVVVIATSNDRYEFPERHVITLRTEDEISDVSFYRHAEQLIRTTIETPGALLIVDDLALLSGAYSTPVPEQQSFLDTLEAAIRIARVKGVRIIVCSSLIPEKRQREFYGAQFWTGVATPVDWMIMFGNAPMVESPVWLGGGICAIDGSFTTFRYPLVPGEQGMDTASVGKDGAAGRRRGLIRRRERPA